MILVGETDPHAREVPFHLPLAADPLSPLIGHVFIVGEVRVRVPGAGYVDADPAAIVEKGYGDYALVLTLAQVATRGDLYLEANVATAQPWTSEEFIGGPITVGETDPTAREVPFHLPDSADPLEPITGHAFLAGEVQLFLVGGGAFVNADPSLVVEKGYGDYALQLTAGQVAAKGKVYLYAKTPNSQPWSSFADVVDDDGDAGDEVIVPPPPPPPVGTNVEAYARMMMDLLPLGRLWRPVADMLKAVILACADEFGRLDARTIDLLDEADPRDADELLPEYERELNLPSDGTDDERQARIVAREIADQGFKPSDFQIALAPLLDQDAADVDVIERTHAFADSIGDDREIYRAFIYRDPTLPGTYFVESAQALVDDIKPSHTIVTVIESIDFLCDDPYSLCDRDLLGA